MLIVPFTAHVSFTAHVMYVITKEKEKADNHLIVSDSED